jgi:hypothetical protein
MNIRTLSLVLGAAVTVAAGGLSATACSSSNDSTGNHSTTDASTNGDTGSSSGGNTDSGGTGDDGGTGTGDDGGAGADCGKPAQLFPNADGGNIYCGKDDAGSHYCAVGQQCCLGGKISGNTFEPQQCGQWGSACPNSGPGDAASSAAIAIECNENADCTANGKSGNVCCLVGASNTTVMGCQPKFSGGSIIQCEAPTNGACAAGETQICQQDTDCPSGMHCNAGHWKVFNVGFCQ